MNVLFYSIYRSKSIFIFDDFDITRGILGISDINDIYDRYIILNVYVRKYLSIINVQVFTSFRRYNFVACQLIRLFRCETIIGRMRCLAYWRNYIRTCDNTIFYLLFCFSILSLIGFFFFKTRVPIYYWYGICKLCMYNLCENTKIIIFKYF